MVIFDVLTVMDNGKGPVGRAEVTETRNHLTCCDRLAEIFWLFNHTLSTRARAVGVTVYLI